MAILLFFCSGIILAGYLPELPSPQFSISLLVIALLLAFFLRKLFRLFLWLFLLLLGFNYGVLAGYSLLENQLPQHFAERDVIVEGKVGGLPQEDSRRQLFHLDVERAYSIQEPNISFKQFPRKLNISSYGDIRVKTGERWRLTVKLKRPRGFVNPGGFDYQASLLRRGVGATGYIRQGDNSLLEKQPKFSMDVLRYELQQWLIEKSQSAEKGILVALLVGDTSMVDNDHWGAMIKTGTNHLIAISGLHLGFFAILGFFIGNLMGRCVQIFWHKYPSMFYGYIFSVLFTLFYSVIAGFNIPTIRTLIMLIVVQLTLLLRRSFFISDSLSLAFVLVLLYDPLAAYDIGFWLSFCAVAMLIFSFSGRLRTVKNDGMVSINTYHFTVFLKSQWIMFVGLLIPLAILIHTSSLLAPPANLVAIPLITFFVVPCLIMSALCHFVFSGFESFFLHCAEWGMYLVHKWLHFLLQVGANKLNPLINFNPWAIGVAVLSVFLLMLPRGLGSKYLGAAGLILALVVPLKPLADLQMLVFDVGQGTAVLIRTPNHQLLYDTGPIYTENFDAGSGIIVPYLQSQGLKSLDVLVVSHNDQDHIGGLNGVLAGTQVDNLWLGEPEKFKSLQSNPPLKSCHTQESWQWDQVGFRFVTWPLQPDAKANNHSCVLMVDFKGHKILLAGDIEKEVERSLVDQKSVGAVDILLAPHHGSHTSSTPEFVSQIHPRTVIYSAGFHNQHGHPHTDIQARYEAVGARALNTASGGALEFSWWDSQMKIVEYRQSARRYWFDDGRLQR